MKIRLGYLLIILLFIKSVCTGQNIEFEHITNREGLVGTSVTAIIKDSYGYMWFGFFDGLSRYDGYSYKNYINDPTNPHSLNDNYVRCFKETPDSNLIIGFQYKGFCIYNRQKDNFERFMHDDRDTNSLINNNILTIYIDRFSNIWVGTRGGLDRFDYKNKRFIHYRIFPQDEIISSITEDEQGNLLLYERGDKICSFNPSTNQITKLDILEDIKKNKKYFYRGGILKYDSHGNLWVGTETSGLARFNKDKEKELEFNLENGELSSNIIYSIHEDSKGLIWIGTDGGGLYIYDYHTNHLTQFLNDPNISTSLSGNAVYSIYESDPGTIWLGVYAAGINIYKRDKRKFLSVTSKGKAGYVLSQKSVLSLYPGETEKIWFGTDGGGLNLFDPKNSKIEYFNTSNSPMTSNIIKCIQRDGEGNFWLGSYASGLCKVNFEKKTATTYLPQLNNSKEIGSENVWALKLDSDRKLWIGLLSFGVQQFDPKHNNFTNYSIDTSSEKKAILDVNVILEDKNKDIWIGAEITGLVHYSRRENKFRFFRHSSDPGSISDNDINTLYEDKNGILWVGTRSGGVNKLIDREKKKFIHYSTRDGLSSDNVKSITGDIHGNIWISTTNGISLLNVKENTFVNFDEEDGLNSKEYNINCAYATANGYIYFGGTQGVNYFHPDSIKYNLIPPKIAFTDFKIFDKSIVPDKMYDGKKYLDSSISISSGITLSHGDNVFSIEFAALDFISPEKNKYAYRLVGFHDSWTYVNSNKRFATFTNLDPGTYRFEVIACNNDGVWNEKGSKLYITILPPWWETLWFRFTCTILMILAITGFYYYRINNIKSRNIYLTREVEKRTKELNETNKHLQERNNEILLQRDEIVHQKNSLEHLNKTKDKFFSIIGHDLKGPVNAFTFLTDMLYKDWENVDERTKKEYMQHIDASSKQVKNLVHSLLEWARTQAGQVKLEPVIISVEKILTENRDVLLEQATQKDIHIEIDSCKEHKAFGDYNMISTIIRNILSNSIKYTYQGKKITLASKIVDDQKLQISITDQGIGMSDNILKKLFSLDKGPSVKGTNKETGTGLGLVISQEFASLNKGMIYAESELGKGSTFYIELPLPVLEPGGGE